MGNLAEIIKEEMNPENLKEFECDFNFTGKIDQDIEKIETDETTKKAIKLFIELALNFYKCYKLIKNLELEENSFQQQTRPTEDNSELNGEANLKLHSTTGHNGSIFFDDPQKTTIEIQGTYHRLSKKGKQVSCGFGH